MNRRTGMISLLGWGCWCGCAHAQTFPRPVVLPQAAAVARGCGFESGIRPRPSPVSVSGVAELDANIGQEIAFLRRVFNITPTFFFGSDTPEYPAAHTYRNAGESGDSTIILGVNFIQREIRLNPSNWQSAIIGVIAHEWAHALQYSSQLQDRQFMWETHADFMSGWYLGVKRAVGNWRIQPEVLATSLFGKGGQKDFFDEDTHGTANVRIGAMLEGFKLGLYGQSGIAVDVYTAANLGYQHAQHVAAK